MPPDESFYETTSGLTSSCTNSKASLCTRASTAANARIIITLGIRRQANHIVAYDRRSRLTNCRQSLAVAWHSPLQAPANEVARGSSQSSVQDHQRLSLRHGERKVVCLRGPHRTRARGNDDMFVVHKISAATHALLEPRLADDTGLQNAAQVWQRADRVRARLRRDILEIDASPL